MREKQVKIQRMKRKLKDCNPTICNRQDLMTGDGIFVDRDVYKNNCSSDCKMKSVCGVIVDLLEQNKWKQATETLKNSKLGKEEKNGIMDLKKLSDRALEKLLLESMQVIQKMMDKDADFEEVQEAMKDLEPIEEEVQSRYEERE